MRTWGVEDYFGNNKFTLSQMFPSEEYSSTNTNDFLLKLQDIQDKVLDYVINNSEFFFGEKLNSDVIIDNFIPILELCKKNKYPPKIKPQVDCIVHGKGLKQTLEFKNIEIYTNTDINKRNIIYFTDVVNCFAGVKHLASKEMNSCICGKKHISDNFLIRNKSTQEEYIVGSTCSRNWFKEDKVKESCKYCNRMKKNGGNCINCSGKIHLKSVFLAWKNEVRENKEMVSFGKYKGVLTYKTTVRRHFQEEIR
jgi:hypothetical protein